MSEAENQDLLKPVSDPEVKEAVFQQDGDRAPGPDGFPGYFFQKFWDVVGADVCKAMKHFFRSGKILRRINTTNIVLVPKKEGLF